MKSTRTIWASSREAHIVGRALCPDACYRALVAAGIEGVAEVTPGSHTVQIRVKEDADPESTLAGVRSIVQHENIAPSCCPDCVVEIPICSDPDLAPDLEAVARNAGLSPDAAADLHATGEYTIRFLGFSPGFPYIDGLPDSLHVPRLDTPRPRVRAGSVGIAGSRTGIYPYPSPGGWNLIGATPLRLFDTSRDQPALLAPGDRIRFRRIERVEFEALETDEA